MAGCADDQLYVRNLARLLGQLLDRIEHVQHTLRRNRYSITAVWAALSSHKGTHVNVECGFCAGLEPMLRLKYVSELTERLNEVDRPNGLNTYRNSLPLLKLMEGPTFRRPSRLFPCSRAFVRTNESPTLSSSTRSAYSLDLDRLPGRFTSQPEIQINR